MELEDSVFKQDVILVIMDMISLYPSIPQNECIETVHNEMVTHSELVICNPNLITYLLQLNMTNNFAGTTFLQRSGTAMEQHSHPLLQTFSCPKFPVIDLRQTSVHMETYR